MPLFSVIIPTFNRACLVAETLEKHRQAGNSADDVIAADAWARHTARTLEIS